MKLQSMGGKLPSPKIIFGARHSFKQPIMEQQSEDRASKQSGFSRPWQKATRSDAEEGAIIWHHISTKLLSRFHVHHLSVLAFLPLFLFECP